MPQFVFNTISRTDIVGSVGGTQMLTAIDYDGPNQLLITGCPGSGKTTVNLMRAQRLKILEKRILLLTYQVLLKISLKNISNDELNNDIFTFHKWFSDKFQVGSLQSSQEVLIDAMKDWSGIDEVIIDEGQDFEKKMYYSLFSKIPKMTVGADNAQKIHAIGLTANEIIEILEQNGQVLQINLQYNYRNTYEIYNFAKHFLPFNERVNNKISIEKILKGSGKQPTIFLVPNEDTQSAQLKILLENAGDRNIAVLVYFKKDVDYFFKLINDMGIACSRHHSSNPIENYIENILVTTYKSAKGLEFEVVIMPKMNTAMSEDYVTPEHYYVGCTRAKEDLFLITVGNSLPEKFNNFQKDSYIYNITGSMLKPLIIKKIPIIDIDEDLPF